MIVGLGIDIVDLDVFRGRLDDALIDELYLPAEAAYCRTQVRFWENFAARLAAKEAAFKALGAGLAQGLRFRDVEVVRGPSGAVELALHGAAAARAAEVGARRLFVSLTHSREAAAAVVVAEDDDD
jgi:holo-[acyl-carrier protein] synthase